MMMNGMGMMMWGVLGSVLGLVLIFLFVLAVAMIIRWLWKPNPSYGESALEILTKRYARGEISKEEFERIKRDIG